MEGHSIHFDKWITMFVPFVSMVIAELALIGDMKGTDQGNLAVLGFLFLVFVIIAMVIHGFRQIQKAKWIIALRYLESYVAKIDSHNDVQLISSNLGVETFEETENRQRVERVEILKG